jgi:NADH:ubiquinone oxidoreductase subunit H
MGTIAGRRTGLVLLATLLAVVACYTVFARRAGAAVRPVQRTTSTTTSPVKGHPTKIADAVKYVRNADGTVTRVR